MGDLVYNRIREYHLYVDYSIQKFEEMAANYAEESSFFKDFYSFEAVRSSFARYASSEDELWVLGDYEGFATLDFSQVFTKEPIAAIGMFYIQPQLRDYTTARHFLTHLIERAEEKGACVVISNSFSSIDERITKGYKALLTRSGLDEREGSQVHMGVLRDV
jgi:GNAT superfamily N-acetyltransferase